RGCGMGGGAEPHGDDHRLALYERGCADQAQAPIPNLLNLLWSPTSVRIDCLPCSRELVALGELERALHDAVAGVGGVDVVAAGAHPGVAAGVRGPGASAVKWGEDVRHGHAVGCGVLRYVVV